MTATTLPLAELLARYDRPGPRYTSYPTAVEFHDGVTADVYAAHLARADALPDAPLSLYVHLPFCEERCGFCGCNVVITPHRDVAGRYLDYLEREIDLLAAHLPPPARRRRSCTGAAARPPTTRPSSSSACSRGWHATSASRPTPRSASRSIRASPRPSSSTTLRRLGFNRLSMGVQDFAPEVQEAVNRIQSYEQTRDAGRCTPAALGFRSLNIDLIYGLPYQTEDGFQQTLDQVVGAASRAGRRLLVRLRAVDGRAHEATARRAALPGPALKIALLARAQRRVRRAPATAQIGMDHFALPDDELGARASRRARCTATSWATPCSRRATWWRWACRRSATCRALFVQNTKKLTEYYEALDAGRFPTERGYVLDEDDALAPPRDHRADVQRPPRRPRGRAPLRRHASPSTSRRSSPTWRRPASPQADGLVAGRRRGRST